MKKVVRKTTTLIVVLLAIAVFWACNRAEEISEQPATEIIQQKPDRDPVQAETVIEDDTEDLEIDTSSALSVQEKPLAFQGSFTPDLQVRTEKASYTTGSHADYLDDPMNFARLETIEKDAKSLGVIGYENSRFYPFSDEIDKLESDTKYDDFIKALGDSMKIPAGVIVEMDYSKRFPFYYHEKEYNYFYKVKWGNVWGVVFGADIYTPKSASPVQELQQYKYYIENESYNFLPYSGRSPLSDRVKMELAAYHFSIQDLDPNEYYDLSMENPDDMISLYKKDVKEDSWKTMFYTTDFYSHMAHLLFANILKDIEESEFTPQLRTLTAKYLAVIRGYKEEIPEEKENYHRLLELAETYFMIPEALLAMGELAMDEKNNKSFPEITEEIEQAVLALYPEDVQKELSLILEANGFAVSPNFNYREDYSQFIARGHYTESARLTSYFKAMMWFGRIHMLIQSYDSADEFNYPLSYLAQAGVFITKITYDNEDILNRWNSLFDPITYLVGAADDLSIRELFSGIDQIPWTTFNEYVDDYEQVSSFAKWAFSNLPKPQISGNSVFNTYAGDSPVDRNKGQEELGDPPMGFRLFGQRFTFDSMVHQGVSPPRLMARNYVTGLDILYALGADNIEETLRIHEEIDNEKQSLVENTLFKTLDTYKDFFNSQDDAFWQQSYYTKVLEMIKHQANFQSGAGYYFTVDKKWNEKAVTAALGQWAALRHDTILYVKQVYAEKAGGGDEEPTFRYINPYKPIHYVEPNIPFYYALDDTLELLNQLLAHYDLMSNGYRSKIAKFKAQIELAIRVSKAIQNNTPVSADDNKALKSVASIMSYIVLRDNVHVGTMASYDEKLRMAIIADVYTQSELGMVLEVGIGKPRRIYVALNDGPGGKRIAQGYTFSYYEFKHPMNDRLTNETWRKWIYEDKKDMSPYIPVWSQAD